VAILDICYRAVLSAGKLDAVLANLPGFGVIREYITIDMLEFVYRLDRHKISSILGETGRRIHGYMAPGAESDFHTDKERAGVHYYDPIAAHVMLCHNLIPILFPPSWPK
jgi:hypothetical protein